MSDFAPRPRSITELIDTAFQVYRRSPGQFIMVAALGYIPWQLIILAVGGTDPTKMAIRTMVVSAIGGVVIYPLVGGVASHMASEIFLGRTADPYSSFAIALRRYRSLIGATLVKEVLAVAGLVLFIVPGLYVVARWFGIVPAVVIEDASAGRALGRSSVLSDGLKLHMLGTLALMFVIYMALSMGVGIVAGFAGNVLVTRVVSLALAPVIAPLFHILETLLYYDARVRREGFDIEMMAGALGVPGAPDTPAATRAS